MSKLDYSVFATSVACDSKPPTDTGEPWSTDVPVDRVILRLGFEDRCIFETIQIVNDKASHIEIRGGETANASWYDCRKIVDKTLLRNMWDHKTGANPNGTHLLVCNKLMSYQEILIGLFNNWEPSTQLGLRSLQVRGRVDPNPQDYPEYTPPVKAGPKIINPTEPDAKPPPPSVITTQSQKVLSKWGSKSPTRCEKKRESDLPSPAVKTPKTDGALPPPPKPKAAEAQKISIPPPPPGKPLTGVTICLSGFKNPERSNLRDQALKLGAKCSDEWAKGGTHLICAYPNTPKYLEVEEEGKGHIVTKDWIGVAAASGARPNEQLYQLRKKGKPY
eukprot:TRINITY_DN19074_c0_g1_i1.p1 TRINITY_DN19074_c0_g1~~TRINITY_DN19074_c0_g1_i1.p1  ORF type:complete len:333 (+),score=52.89 TRINITY_DN19074_c0_g1_i1:211-1209(+)